jgi:heme oxygenase (biliverdin-IX-beta and delta-forming)
VILEQLKSATASAHSSLERRLRIAQERPSLLDYRNYLRAMYGFTAPLEARLRLLPRPFADDVEFESRCKAELLLEDLAALERRSAGRAELAARCRVLPESQTSAQAMGILYVLEGSTLGARWLLRHLQPLGLEDCSAYLQSYGEALGPMWQKMRAALVRHAELHPEQTATTLAAAGDTFRALDDWFVQCDAAKESRAA